MLLFRGYRVAFAGHETEVLLQTSWVYSKIRDPLKKIKKIICPRNRENSGKWPRISGKFLGFSGFCFFQKKEHLSGNIMGLKGSLLQKNGSEGNLARLQHLKASN